MCFPLYFFYKFNSMPRDFVFDSFQMNPRVVVCSVKTPLEYHFDDAGENDHLLSNTAFILVQVLMERCPHLCMTLADHHQAQKTLDRCMDELQYDSGRRSISYESYDRLYRLASRVEQEIRDARERIGGLTLTRVIN